MKMKKRDSNLNILYTTKVTIFKTFLKKSSKIVNKRKLRSKIQNKNINTIFTFIK